MWNGPRRAVTVSVSCSLLINIGGPLSIKLIGKSRFPYKFDRERAANINPYCRLRITARDWLMRFDWQRKCTILVSCFGLWVTAERQENSFFKRFTRKLFTENMEEWWRNSFLNSLLQVCKKWRKILAVFIDRTMKNSVNSRRTEGFWNF